MPQEPLVDNLGNDEADPLATDVAEDTTPVETGSDVEVDQPAEAGDDPAAGITGTPFKDQPALVDGYKNLQRLVASKDREIATLSKQVDAIASAFQQMRTGKPVAAKPLEGKDFWDAFAKDPNALLAQLIQNQFDQAFKDKLEPKLGSLEGSVSNFERQNRVNDFLRENPELTSEEEDAMVEILEANPHLKELPDGLSIAYDKVIASRWRQDQNKSKTANAVAGAKGVAGLGGKKTSLPAQQTNQDPFDEVLNLDKNDRELFKLGRKA